MRSLSPTSALRLYYLVFFAAIGAYLPFFPTWLEARGVTGLGLGTVMALQPLFGMVGPVVFGIAADAFALRGSLLRVAAASALAAFGALAVLGLLGHDPSYPVLLGLFAVFSFFRGPMVSMADVTALEEPGSYGRTRLFGSAGFVAGLLVAGATVNPTSRAGIPLLVTVLLGLTLVTTLALPKHSARPPSPITWGAARRLLGRDTALLLAASFLWYGAQVSYDLCFSLHLRDLGASPARVSVTWALGVASEIAAMAVGARAFARFAPARVLAASLGVVAARSVLLAVVRSPDVLLLLQPLHAIAFGMVWVAALEIVRARAPAGLLATAQSLFAMATSMGAMIGMLLWGPLYAKHGGPAVFFGAAVFAAAACGAALAIPPGATADPS